MVELNKSSQLERFCRDALAQHARFFRLWQQVLSGPNRSKATLGRMADSSGVSDYGTDGRHPVALNLGITLIVATSVSGSGKTTRGPALSHQS
jgi:hypothetical protein